MSTITQKRTTLRQFEAAKLAGVSVQAVAKAGRLGKFRVYRPDGVRAVLVDYEDFVRWCERRRDQ